MAMSGVKLPVPALANSCGASQFPARNFASYRSDAPEVKSNRLQTITGVAPLYANVGSASSAVPDVVTRRTPKADPAENNSCWPPTKSDHTPNH